MPLVRVSMRAGSAPGVKQTISSHIYEAMRETIGIPAGDRFVVIGEHSENTLFLDPNFMGIERSEDSLVIEITLRRGRTVEQKQKLYAEIAKRLAEHASVRPEDIFVTLLENESSDWSFGNGVAQFIEKA